MCVVSFMRVIRVDVCMFTHRSKELQEKAAPTLRGWQDRGHLGRGEGKWLWGHLPVR